MLAACAAAACGGPDRREETVRELVERHLDAVVPKTDGGGLVVAVVSRSGAEVLEFGDARRDWVLEIGSITKAFTGVLLADMSARGEVSPGDTVSRWLPGAEGPAADVTLEQLSTHTSGLPRLPPNFEPSGMDNPYADYTARQLVDAVGLTRLESEPGTQVAYSNYGAGLLGHVLATAAGVPYERLVVDRVCGPLGMDETGVTLPAGLAARMATGHRGGSAVPGWDIPAMAGAGALRSTIDDMLAFLRANLDPSSTPIAGPLDAAQRPRAGDGATRIGYGWHETTVAGLRVTWHNGATGGFHSFVGFARAEGSGAVALRNTSVDDGRLDAPMMRLIATLSERR